MKSPKTVRSSIVFAVALLLAIPGSLRAQDFELLEATIEEAHAAMERGRLTCRSLVQAYIDRIEAYDTAGPRLNAIQYLNERALDEADALDGAMRSDGRVGPLHCIPVLLKDQVQTSDMPTTYGSALFQDFIPSRDATIVTRLKVESVEARQDSRT